MYEIRKHKIDIRKHHLARRAAIPSEVRAVRDAKICQNLLSAATYRYADIVLMYYPVKGEVDILPVFRAAIAAGKKVAFPRCHAEDRSMIFYFVESEADFEDAGSLCHGWSSVACYVLERYATDKNRKKQKKVLVKARLANKK